MSEIVYGVGGYRPNHPSLGRVFHADDATATVTRWNDAGVVIETRPYTVAETTRAIADAVERTALINKTTIEQRAAAFITATNTYLAIPSPTNAQVAAQVRRNAMATIGLVKILLNQLDNTDGTA